LSVSEWISAPINWVFLVVGILVLLSSVRVVTARNVVHAALYLIGALGGTAFLFLMLSAEFVAWALVLIYIGAVLVLFLFGIMITRAPTGKDVGLDSPNKLWPAVLSGLTFVLLSWASIDGFGSTEIVDIGEATSTEILGLALLGRFVIPFEVVSFVLLAALVGGVTIARRDLSPLEEEQRGAV
jgi:NADH-quinone oxidoreductase subunit J